MYGTLERTWPPLTGCSVASLLHAAATMPRARCFVSALDAMALVEQQLAVEIGVKWPLNASHVLRF
jgi:hypothetical protein